MSEQCWLNDSNITFPLAAGTKILTGREDALPSMAEVEDVFAEESIGSVKLIEDGRTVTLIDAGNQDEWSSQSRVKEIFAALAPICPDGTYAEFESTYPDSDARTFRLVVADDEVVEDFPSISWDPPEQIAQNAIARQSRSLPVEREMTGEQLLDHLGDSSTVPFAARSPEGEIGLVFEIESGDVVIHFAPAEDGTPRHRTVDPGEDGPFLVWSPSR